MTGPRCVVPEILDELPADDPAAIRSRRDLRWIDAVMGNYRWIATQLRSERFTGIRWLELGAGDGGLARHLSKEQRRTLSVSAVDLAPRPASWPQKWEWCQGDVFDFLTGPERAGEFEGVLASLFLHHFDDAALAEIGRLISGCRVVVLVEPARRRLHHLQCYLARPLMNRVTHHDSHVSINAGFLGDELPRRLGLDENSWRIRLHQSWFGSYRLLAARND